MREEVRREVEQFLYREARLLDERRFAEWLELFTDDARYWMPVRTTRYTRQSKAIAILDRDRYEDEELAKEGELAFLDETKKTLEMRIARLKTGMAWAEEPPSRTRRIIANVEAEDGETESEMKVYSNFVLYRTRLETEQDLYVGRREDVFRMVDGNWKIARRKIILDQNVLLAKNLSSFF
jgi:3-phenylpropionate/cinnamic acid dioxygenase small subunit